MARASGARGEQVVHLLGCHRVLLLGWQIARAIGSRALRGAHLRPCRGLLLLVWQIARAIGSRALRGAHLRFTCDVTLYPSSDVMKDCESMQLCLNRQCATRRRLYSAALVRTWANIYIRRTLPKDFAEALDLVPLVD